MRFPICIAREGGNRKLSVAALLQHSERSFGCCTCAGRLLRPRPLCVLKKWPRHFFEEGESGRVRPARASPAQRLRRTFLTVKRREHCAPVSCQLKAAPPRYESCMTTSALQISALVMGEAGRSIPSRPLTAPRATRMRR